MLSGVSNLINSAAPTVMLVPFTSNVVVSLSIANLVAFVLDRY